jgi:hypothetical protein
MSVVAKGSQAGDRSAKVIFIRGLMPRSGTNFVIDVLSKHDQTWLCPGSFWEFAPFRHQAEIVNCLNRMEAGHHTPLFRTNDFLPYIGDAWLRYLAGGDIDRVMLFKEPSVTDLETMFTIFPHAKVVFMVRDGRDIVASLLKAGFGFPPFQLSNYRHWRRLMPGEDFRIACRQVDRAARTLMSFMKSAYGIDRQSQWRMVRFEELIDSPQITLSALLDWLKLPCDLFDWDAFNLMPVRGSSYLRDLDGKMNFGKGVERSAEFNPVGRWGNWSPSQVKIYQRIAGKSMAELGYAH